MPTPLLILAAVAALVVLARVALDRADLGRRKAAEERQRMLSTASTATLLELVQAQVDESARERFVSARRLSTLPPSCTDSELAFALDAYVAEASAAQPPELASGREGVYFAAWDSGLLAIREVLASRTPRLSSEP